MSYNIYFTSEFKKCYTHAHTKMPRQTVLQAKTSSTAAERSQGSTPTTTKNCLRTIDVQQIIISVIYL